MKRGPKQQTTEAREKIRLSSKAKQTPEMKKRISDKMKAHIAEHGLHLKRGNPTSLEKIIINLLQSNNICFNREQRSANIILNAYRFFDFYLPELQILIEVDGEFWHRQEFRIKIDELKHADALIQGCTFLRLSDVYDKQLLEQPEQLLALIINKPVHETHTANIIFQRSAYIAKHGFTPTKDEAKPMTPEKRSKVLGEKSKASWEKRKAEGYVMSAETKEKLSKARAGKTFGPREKPYTITKPRPPVTEETREKMRIKAQARRLREREAKAIALALQPSA